MKRSMQLAIAILFAASAFAQATPPPAEVVNWSNGIAYAYDASGNLRQIGKDIFVYDHVGRLVQADVNGSRRNYEYDAYGNRKSCWQGLGTPGMSDCQTYTVNPTDNHLNGVSYDPLGSGNITMLDGHGYTYDEFNMMKRDQAGDAREFVYTADDERIAVYTTGTHSWRWTVRDLANNPLREFASDGGAFGTGSFRWLKDYIWREGLLLATRQPEGSVTTTYHYHLDHAGTPRRITDNADNRVGFHDYHAFGPEIAGGQNEPSGTAIKYTGHERDSTGSIFGTLDYMHARYYSPSLGRFLSIDPARSANTALPQSWNRYSYVRNNPLRFIDPDGLAEIDIHVYAAPAGGSYSQLTFMARLYGNPRQSPERFSKFGHHSFQYTDGSWAAKDLKRSLSTPGAFVIYFGHAGFAPGPVPLGLDPVGHQKRSDLITIKQLTQMLSTSKASIVLITGCSSAQCVSPGLKSSAGAIVAIRPTSEKGAFSSANYTARATDIFVNAVLGTQPDSTAWTPPATVGEAIDQANQELIERDQPYRFVLIWGDASTLLTPDPAEPKH
jgi:RHS repeat-associated protein